MALLLSAQAYQESNGFIEMDGERFPPEDPREKAEGTLVQLVSELDTQSSEASVFWRWAARPSRKSDRQFTVGVNRLGTTERAL